MTENPNTNCLEDMQCPECESFGPFRIEVKQMATMHDNGLDDFDGDTEWNEKSYCRCQACDYDSIVETFRPEAQSVRRIKACFDFCDGLSTEMIKSGEARALLIMKYDLINQIAEFNKWGELVDGEPFEPGDGMHDSHETLMDLIDQARAIRDYKHSEQEG